MEENGEPLNLRFKFEGKNEKIIIVGKEDKQHTLNRILLSGSLDDRICYCWKLYHKGTQINPLFFTAREIQDEPLELCFEINPFCCFHNDSVTLEQIDFIFPCTLLILELKQPVNLAIENIETEELERILFETSNLKNVTLKVTKTLNVNIKEQVEMLLACNSISSLQLIVLNNKDFSFGSFLETLRRNYTLERLEIGWVNMLDNWDFSSYNDIVEENMQDPEQAKKRAFEQILSHISRMRVDSSEGVRFVELYEKFDGENSLRELSQERQFFLNLSRCVNEERILPFFQLIKSIEDNQEEKMKELMSQFETLEGNELNGEQTLLHFACKKKQVKKETLQMIVEKDVLVKSIDKKGYNALDYYLRWREDVCLEVLNFFVSTEISFDLSIKTTIDFVDRALSKEEPDLKLINILSTLFKKDLWNRFCSEHKTSVQVAKAILTNAINLKQMDKEKRNSLHLACANEKSPIEFLEFLCDKGLSFNVQSSKRITPAHLFCQRRNVERKELERLVLRNTQILLPDDEGRDCLYYLCAQKNVKKQCIELLISKGANLIAKTTDKRTALHNILSIEGVDPEALEFVIDRVSLPETKKQASKIVFFTLLQKPSIPLTLVEMILQKGFDVNVTQRSVSAFNFLCLLCKDAEIVHRFISVGADLESTDQEGRNCLHFALSQQDPSKEVLDILFSNGAKDNGSVLNYYLSSHRPDLELVKFLRKKGCKFASKNGEKGCLHFACENENVDWDIISLIVDEGVDPNVRDEGGRTCVHFLCQRSNLQVDLLKRMVEKGADALSIDDIDSSCLYYACKSQRLRDEEVIQHLLSLEGSKKFFEHKLRSVLHIYCTGRLDNEILRKMISRGADAKLKNKDSLISPLSSVCANESVNGQAISVLLENGADANTREKEGDFPLIELSKNKFAKVDSFIALLEKVKDVEVKDLESKMTPLLIACDIKLPDKFIIHSLLSKGADPNYRNIRGNCLEILMEKQPVDAETVRMLYDHGLECDDGRTLFNYLSRYKGKAVIRVLVEKAKRLNYVQEWKLESCLHSFMRLPHMDDLTEMAIDKTDKILLFDIYRICPFLEACRTNRERLVVRMFAAHPNFDEFRDNYKREMKEELDILLIKNSGNIDSEKVGEGLVKYLKMYEEYERKGTVWNTEIHQFFPREIKERIFTLFLVNKRRPPKTNIPKFVLYLIFSMSTKLPL